MVVIPVKIAPVELDLYYPTYIGRVPKATFDKTGAYAPYKRLGATSPSTTGAE